MCHKVVDGVECGYCGYREIALDGEDPNRVLITYGGGGSVSVSRCANVQLGLRCADPGTLSTTTRAGIDGKTPWYCRKHFRPLLDGAHNELSAPPRGFQALKAIVRRVDDPAADAERAAIQHEQ
jgi:hypothetical protein